jgi:CRAL/TRIO domain
LIGRLLKKRDKFWNFRIFIPLFLRKHLPSQPAHILVKVCYDTDVISQTDLVNFMVMGLEIGLDDDIFSVCGVSVILDYQDLKMGHVLQYTPLYIKQLVTLLQTSAPTRLKGFHFVNVAPAFVFISAILKSLLPEKIRKRVWVHMSMTELHQHVPKEILPQEMGGLAPTVPELIEDFEAVVRSKRDLLMDCKNFGVDERKRPCAAKKSEEILEGSFRKITVD